MKTALSPHNRAKIRQMLDEAPDGWIFDLREPTRSLSQNALMWDLLTAISQQKQWDGEWLEPEEWKDLITAVLKGQKMRRGIEGGIVVTGGRTSKMTIREMNEVIEYCYYFAAENKVRLPAREAA